MKLKHYSIAALLGAGLLITNSANAQWTRNAGTQQTYITNTGDFVGIGTTSPSFKLDIQGTGTTTMSFKSTTGNASILLDRGASNATSSLTYRSQGNNVWQTGIISNTNYQIRNNVLAAPALSILSANSFVGIGTNAPTEKLTVVTAGPNSGFGVYSSNANRIGMDMGRSNVSELSIGIADGPGSFVTGSVAGDVVFRSNSGTNNFLFASGGGGAPVAVAITPTSVGIGTTSPSSKLEVNGNITLSTGAARTISTPDATGGAGAITGYDLTVKAGDAAFDGQASSGGNLNLTAGTANSNFSSPAGGDIVLTSGGNYWSGGYNGDIIFRSAGAEYMRLNGTNGRFGIGTATAGGQFELSADQGRKPSTSTWTITSDARLKTIDGAYTKGLAEIIQLNPITYHYKNVGERKFDERTIATQAVGFTAQDVQKIFPEAVGTDDDGYLNLNIHAILIASINSIKELNTKLEDMKVENTNLKSCIESLCNASISNSNSKVGAASTEDALFQNQPNPFNSITTISYALVKGNAQIIIRDLSGNLVKSFNLAQTGKGQVTVNANELAQGTYTYTLVVNGNAVDTKLMVITK